MMMCLDVGNTHIFGGVFVGEEIVLRFRYPSSLPMTGDTFGLFLRDLFAAHEMSVAELQQVVICSVVPALEPALRVACQRYLRCEPLMTGVATNKTLTFCIDYPAELGADRIACATAACHRYPDQPLIVVDFGTATTVCAISAKREYLGGAIFPGIETAMKSLSRNTARLPDVPLQCPEDSLGKSTRSQLQSGLFYGQLGTLRELIAHINQAHFAPRSARVIATGGFSYLYEQALPFLTVEPDLVLWGLRTIALG